MARAWPPIKPFSSIGSFLAITEFSATLCAWPARSVHATSTLIHFCGSVAAAAVTPSLFVTAQLRVNVVLVVESSGDAQLGQIVSLAVLVTMFVLYVKVPVLRPSKERRSSIFNWARRTASLRCLATSELRVIVICMPARASMPNDITTSAISASISVKPACAAGRWIRGCFMMEFRSGGRTRAQRSFRLSRQLPGTRTMVPKSSVGLNRSAR